jgi:hypothetical protein
MLLLHLGYVFELSQKSVNCICHYLLAFSAAQNIFSFLSNGEGRLGSEHLLETLEH